MRIIFVINNTYPNGKASSARVREYGKGFVSNGVRTIVLIPQPRIPANCENVNPEGSGTDCNGVEYVAMTGSQKRSANVVVRQIVDLWGKLYTSIWLLLNLQKEDKVIVYEGKNNWMKNLLFICGIKKVEVGLELNELPWGCGNETPAAIRNRQQMLKSLFPKFTFFLCISQPLCELANQYAPKSKCIKVPIMFEGQYECACMPIESKPFIFHSGTLYEQKDGICGMLEAFGIAVKEIGPDINYILTGNINDSPHKKEIEEIISEYHIEKQVKFLGYVDELTLRWYQKNCLLTIINKYDTQQNRFCFSTKLSEYLFFSRPVITTSVGEANAYLKDGINAFVVEPCKPEMIANKIVYIYNHSELADRIGREGYKLATKEFDCIYQTKRVINALT